MKRFIDSTVIFLVLIFIVVVVTFAILYLQLRTDQVSTLRESEPVVRILLVLHDDGDAFITAVLFLDSEQARMAILDVPENIGSVIPDRGVIDAIDTVFDPTDPVAYRSIIATLIGADIPMHLVFSTSQMSDFIDLLGGIELFVISDYRETEREDPILLPSGNVVLDGPKALAYVASDGSEESEIERIGRKQSFIQALLRSVQRDEAFLVHPDVTPYRDAAVETNLDRRSLSSLLSHLAEADVDQIIRRRVQGTARLVDVDGVSKALLFPHFEGQWLQQSVRQIEEALVADGDLSDETALIRIEILNGTTISGFARRTSQLYEEYGFEVRRFGNAESDDVERTIVIDRRGYQGFAARVAGVIQADQIVTELAPEGDVDVTVILGRDFDGTVVRNE